MQYNKSNWIEIESDGEGDRKKTDRKWFNVKTFHFDWVTTVPFMEYLSSRKLNELYVIWDDLMCDEAFLFNVPDNSLFGVWCDYYYTYSVVGYSQLLFHTSCSIFQCVQKFPILKIQLISCLCSTSLFIILDIHFRFLTIFINIRQIVSIHLKISNGFFHFPLSFRVFSQWSIKNRWIWANLSEWTKEGYKKYIVYGFKTERWTKHTAHLSHCYCCCSIALWWFGITF